MAIKITYKDSKISASVETDITIEVEDPDAFTAAARFAQVLKSVRHAIVLHAIDSQPKEENA